MLLYFDISINEMYTVWQKKKKKRKCIFNINRSPGNSMKVNKILFMLNNKYKNKNYEKYSYYYKQTMFYSLRWKYSDFTALR